MLEGIADDASMPVADRLRAIDMLGKYGLGTRSDITSGDEKVDRDLDQILIDVHNKLAKEAEAKGMPATAEWERYQARQIELTGLTNRDVAKPRSVLLEEMEGLKLELAEAPEFCPWDAA